MLELLGQVPRYWMFHRFGWPKVMPVNVAVSIISTCNSRCLTCNIWMKRENELSLDEWDKVLRSLGQIRVAAHAQLALPAASLQLECAFHHENKTLRRRRASTRTLWSLFFWGIDPPRCCHPTIARHPVNPCSPCGGDWAPLPVGIGRIRPGRRGSSDRNYAGRIKTGDGQLRHTDCG